MKISARVENRSGSHVAEVRTESNQRRLELPPKAAGNGSAVNGGELLMLALATCYCNDLYREAERLGIAIDGVEVEASAQFAGIGLAASDIVYRARIDSRAPEDQIERLLRETDAVAEIQNTIRNGAAITRVSK
jgi:uncharacterized OsmC-like protein